VWRSARAQPRRLGDSGDNGAQGNVQRRLLSFLLLGAAALVACTPKPETLHLTPAQWREDLQFFAHELPRRHKNAFHHISRERFEAEVQALDQRVAGLDGDAIYVGMARIANLIGDAHTYLRTPQDDADFAFDFRRFGDVYRVTSAVVGQERALGARVLKVENTPLEGALRLARELTPDDENAAYREAVAPLRLSAGILLHGSGVTPDRNVAHYTLTDGDGDFTVEVRATAANSPPPKAVNVPSEPPLFRQQPEEPFRVVWLADHRAVYCNFRSYTDLGAHAKSLFALIHKENPDKLVVDLRGNGGGDYFEGLKYLVEPIRKLGHLNRRGHLFVLIGPFTFSAAMANAAHFRQRTAALLVGETIGEKPNSYQEPEEVVLPNSHFTLRYSTRYYEFLPGGDNAIHPDQEIVPTWEQRKAGRDPVLEWALAFRDP
jgi:hypothetical protein